MIIAARNAMMAGKSILPPGARWVEYLESTGTQYIDSGIECTSDINVSFSAQCLTSVNLAMCGGIRTDQAPIYFRHHSSPSEPNAYWCQNNAVNEASLKLPQGTTSTDRLTIEVYPRDGRGSINGTNYSFSQLQQGLTTGKSYGIFGRISNNGSIQSRPSRIWYFGIYNNSALVRNFRPIAIGNTGYMFDLVTGDYLQYGNKGTGNFVIGPNIAAPTI